jgi:hypothetical protein
MARAEPEFAIAIAFEDYNGNAQARNLKPADHVSFTENLHLGTLCMRTVISLDDLVQLVLGIPLEQVRLGNDPPTVSKRERAHCD